MPARSMCGRPVPPCSAAKDASHQYRHAAIGLGIVVVAETGASGMRPRRRAQRPRALSTLSPERTGTGRDGRTSLRGSTRTRVSRRLCGGLGRRRGPPRGRCSGGAILRPLTQTAHRRATTQRTTNAPRTGQPSSMSAPLPGDLGPLHHTRHGRP